MNIGQTNRSLSLSSLVRAQALPGRINVPVKSSHFAYARFKHVAGFPSSKEGVSIMKLKTLDVLIDRLKSLKSKKMPEITEINRSSESIDAMIEKYENELHIAAKQASVPYSNAFSETGIIVNAVA